MAGLTGPINFDARGFRTDFNLDIIELKQEGLVKVTINCIILILAKMPKLRLVFVVLHINSITRSVSFLQVGGWNSTSGCNFTRNFTESYNVIVQSLLNKTLTITTIMV